MSTAEIHRYSPQEYLRLERAAEYKSQLYDGEIFAMSGGTREHSHIAINLAASIHPQLKDTKCEINNSDLRVAVSASGMYTYSDASIVCGKMEFVDKQSDTLLNPRVTFEILSESTERFDRGKKFESYRQIASLQEYILISQDQPLVERFVRGENGTWQLTLFQGLDAVLELTSVACRVPLREIYDRIEFGAIG